MSFLHPGIRRLALQIPRPAFICRQCLRHQKLAPPCRIAQIVRSRGHATTADATPLSSLSSKIATAEAATAASKAGAAPETISSSAGSKKAFPEYSSRAVAYWLLGSAASVFGIVVFGGLTRLTESG